MLNWSKRFLLLALLLCFVISPSQSYANLTGQFSQGDQYEQGAYDLNAEQPAVYNWDRNSKYKSIDSDPTIKWIFGPSGTAFKSALVVGSDGTIYAGDRASNKVYAINSDGTEKWAYISNEPTEQFPRAIPAIGIDGTIYANSNFRMHAINPDGTEKWVVYIGGSTNGPTIDKDGVIYFTRTNVLYAYNPDGTLKWQASTYSYTTEQIPTPMIGGNGNIYVLGRTNVDVFNKNGTKLWSSALTLYDNPNVVIAPDGTIYMADTGRLFALNPDGTLKWSLRVGGEEFGVPAVGKDGTIYVGLQHATKFYAINPDGTVKWVVPTNYFYMRDAPIIDNSGNIYIRSQSNNSGIMTALSSDGTKLWELVVNGSYEASTPPVIAKDGTIYMTTGQGIVAIGGKINKPINVCEVFNTVSQNINDGLTTPEEISQARSDIDALKAKIQELEEKVIEAENNISEQ